MSSGSRSAGLSIAEAPIALCEVQGYAYLARRTAALLAADLGERKLGAALEAQATG